MKDTKYIRLRKRKYGSALLIDIPYKDDNGNQKHFTKTLRILDYPNEKQAWSSARKIRNDALRCIETGKLRMTVPSLRNIYLRRWDVLPLSVKSRERADNTFRRAFLPYQDIPLSEITLEQIQLTLNTVAEKYPADGVQRVLSLWRSLYKTASILGYDIPDKTVGAVLPVSKVTNQPRNVIISDEDFFAFCDALLLYNSDKDIQHNNLAVWYMLQIMYYTGCRPAEALALQRKDIFPDHISINKSVGSTTSKKQQIIPTKTVKSTRDVPTVPELQSVLQSLLAWSDSEQLITDESGSLFEINYVSNLIRRVSHKSGIKFTAYMLRHKMSTDLLHAGNSVVARDLLGHSSFGMTLDYARSTPEQLLSAISAERQPKKSDQYIPSATILRQYQIMRFLTVLRIICIIKAQSKKSRKRL